MDEDTKAKLFTKLAANLLESIAGAANGEVLLSVLQKDDGMEFVINMKIIRGPTEFGRLMFNVLDAMVKLDKTISIEEAAEHTIKGFASQSVIMSEGEAGAEEQIKH